MPTPLDRLSIAGFRSIRELHDFPLRRLNVLVGANGAGKSNFVEFLRMLRAMFQEDLQGFVARSGGGDGLFFEGPQVTPEIRAALDFGDNQLHFRLESVPGNELIIAELGPSHATLGKIAISNARGMREARVREWKTQQSAIPLPLALEAVPSWVVYHFHDTRNLAPMRREGPVYDHHELRPNGDNLAAILRHLRESAPDRYQRIRETIQIIAPFFDDFLFEIRERRNDELVCLDWRQRGSTFPYQPWHLSDGTLRFIALTTALLQPNPPALIVIDEPELGLHPAALHVIAGLMHEAATTTQLIVSTQSPLLVDHFDPDDIVVVRRHGNESVFERLEPADLERWLDEYTLGDLMLKDVIETGP